MCFKISEIIHSHGDNEYRMYLCHCMSASSVKILKINSTLAICTYVTRLDIR